MHLPHFSAALCCRPQRTTACFHTSSPSPSVSFKVTLLRVGSFRFHSWYLGVTRASPQDFPRRSSFYLTCSFGTHASASSRTVSPFQGHCCFRVEQPKYRDRGQVTLMRIVSPSLVADANRSSQNNRAHRGVPGLKALLLKFYF